VVSRNFCQPPPSDFNNNYKSTASLNRPLASDLLKRGLNVTSATTTPVHVGEVYPDGIRKETLPTRDLLTPVREFVRDHADVTVTDSYLVDGAYQPQLRDVSPLVAITDDTQYAIAADVHIGSDLNGPHLDLVISCVLSISLSYFISISN